MEQASANSPSKKIDLNSPPGGSQIKVPDDFVSRVATKIIVINERELDENQASAKVAQMIYRNLGKPGMVHYFFDVIGILLETEDAEKYAAVTWASLVINQEEHPEYEKFLDEIATLIVKGHQKVDRPDHEPEYKHKKFSAYAYNLGEVFINMMAVNSDLYDILTEIFSKVIGIEMEETARPSEDSGQKKISLSLVGKKKDDEIVNAKKLYDDLVDYISYRGEYTSDSLNQKNPNEFIIVLADRLRSTRRYIIQDLMNKQALERRKQMEKDLREREASAEEIIGAATPFKKGLFLYWVEKRYNFKYLAVEKVRVTLQILAIILGLGAMMLGYLEISYMTIIEGSAICGLMIFYSKLVCSKNFFESFYPVDVTSELEQEVGIFTPPFRKMSGEQLHMFLVRQIKHPGNGQVNSLIPEYIRYIYTVMPDREGLLIKPDELSEIIEKVEVDISKFTRGKSI